MKVWVRVSSQSVGRPDKIMPLSRNGVCLEMRHWISWVNVFTNAETVCIHQRIRPQIFIDIFASACHTATYLYWTRTTRTPSFWGLPYHWVILDPKSKEDKVKVTNLKNSPKFHLLKLLDKMCKYEMDPMSIVEDTERTRFCPQTDRQTDGQTDKVKPVYPPFNFVETGGLIISFANSYFSSSLSWHKMKGGFYAFLSCY